jgi:soluble lytic murein transglycosylase-like protein
MPARTSALALLAFLMALGAVAVSTGAASAYTVQPGDTLWGLSQRTGLSVKALAQRNRIADPDRIYAGQHLDLATPPPPVASPVPAAPPVAPARTMSLPAARALLVAAARRHGVDPDLVLAVSWWESGWNQNMVSKSGAIGMMQITPGTARAAAPGLLHRSVDIRQPGDNADLGAALLASYVARFHDPRLALAAYYQGPNSVPRYGIYPSSRGYVDGIMALRGEFAAGRGPA